MIRGRQAARTRGKRHEEAYNRRDGDRSMSRKREPSRRGVPLQVRSGLSCDLGSLGLLRFAEAAVSRLADGALTRARSDARGRAVLTAATTGTRRAGGGLSMRRTAGHLALIASTVHAPPGRVHAGGAVRAAPGADGRHEARDQEGHQQREYGYQTGSASHGLRR